VSAIRVRQRLLTGRQFLKPLPDSHMDTPTYELCYAQEAFSKVSYPEELAPVGYEEPEMAKVVRLIRINLRNVREFLIQSRRPPA
jgi:hypothetical protein